MSQPAPEGSLCGTHRDTPAAWTCGRCGAFFCAACERRTRPEALPMCPSCWELRARQVRAPPDDSQRLRIAGAVTGVLALVPMCWWMQLTAIALNIIGLVRGRKQQTPREWLNVAGLVGGVIGLLLTIGLFAFAAVSKR